MRIITGLFNKYVVMDEEEFSHLFRNMMHGIIREVGKRDLKSNGFAFSNEAYEILSHVTIEELEPLESINYKSPLLDLPENWRSLHITIGNGVRWQYVAERYPNGEVQLMPINY